MARDCSLTGDAAGPICFRATPEIRSSPTVHLGISPVSTHLRTTSSFPIPTISPVPWCLAAGDMVREIYQRWRQVRLDIEPRLIERRRGIYPLVRAAATVLLRDMTVYTVIGDILAGKADAVYATFRGLRRGCPPLGRRRPGCASGARPAGSFLSAVSNGRSMKSKRTYQIVVLSDHGQSKGATFKQRFGIGLT